LLTGLVEGIAWAFSTNYLQAAHPNPFPSWAEMISAGAAVARNTSVVTWRAMKNSDPSSGLRRAPLQPDVSDGMRFILRKPEDTILV